MAVSMLKLARAFLIPCVLLRSITFGRGSDADDVKNVAPTTESIFSQVTVPAFSSKHSIVNYPIDTRKSNLLRVSHHSCSECLTLDEFYAGNRWSFLLFFDRGLQSTSKYKKTIVEGFMKACGELRWTRIACGMIDMIEDRAYAEKYIDPKTAPAHIIVVDGAPIALGKHHVDALMKKPGDLPTIHWHLRDAIAPSIDGMIDISSEISSEEALTQVLKRHANVIVIAATSGDITRREAIRAAAQSVLLEAEGIGKRTPPVAGAVPPATKGKTLRTWQRERQRERCVFAIVTRHAALKEIRIDSNAAVVFREGVQVLETLRALPEDVKDFAASAKAFSDILNEILPASPLAEGSQEGSTNERAKIGKGGLNSAAAKKEDSETSEKASPTSSASAARGKGGKKSKAEL